MTDTDDENLKLESSKDFQNDVLQYSLDTANNAYIEQLQRHICELQSKLIEMEIKHKGLPSLRERLSIAESEAKRLATRVAELEGMILRK